MKNVNKFIYIFILYCDFFFTNFLLYILHNKEGENYLLWLTDEAGGGGGGELL